MKKICIVLESTHHGNTRKVINKIKSKFPEVISLNPSELYLVDLEDFDAVCFSSGIYYGGLSKDVQRVFEGISSNEKIKNVFFIYTSGNGSPNYSVKFIKMAKAANKNCLGAFWCKGFDTFGPLRYIGGISKDHPNQLDYDKAIEFFDDVIKKLD
jgi:flavodoxin